MTLKRFKANRRKFRFLERIGYHTEAFWRKAYLDYKEQQFASSPFGVMLSLLARSNGGK